MVRGLSKRFGWGSAAIKRAEKKKRRLIFESLEDRRLLALLPVSPQLPLVNFTGPTGSLTYDASTQAFDMVAPPLSFFDGIGAPKAIIGTRSTDIHVKVDHAGNLVGGVPGDDFRLVGHHRRQWQRNCGRGGYLRDAAHRRGAAVRLRGQCRHDRQI